MPSNSLAYSPTLALIESHVAIYKIYILRNPIDEKIFYVGQTMLSLETRLSGHISGTGSNRDKINYIKKILESGNKPFIEAIETIATTCYIDKMAVNEREIYWIRYHKSLGCELLNKSSIAPNTKCHEYHGYLSAIRKGETSWHYYYCGKTAGGYSVYDEAKLKADGFRLREPEPETVTQGKIFGIAHYYNPLEYIKYLVKMGLAINDDKNKKEVATENYPIQPHWTLEFKASIPHNDIFEDIEFDDCDYEEEEIEDDMCDYELTGDDEREYYEEQDHYVIFEPIHFTGWTLSSLVLPQLYFVTKIIN